MSMAKARLGTELSTEHRGGGSSEWKSTITSRTPLHYPNPFRQWTTVELLRQQEVIGWELAGLPEMYDSDHQLRSAIEFLESELADVESELARRQRWKHSQYAPEWPAGLPDLKSFWQSIKGAVSVRDLYERHCLGILKKSGANWRGPCPICALRDPSSRNRPAFSIFDNEQGWYCHRCHEGGDVLALARWLFNDRDFHRAALAVADEFGIERPESLFPKPKPLGDSVSGINGHSRKKPFRALEYRAGKWERP